jgi:hypothetical protein
MPSDPMRLSRRLCNQRTLSGGATAQRGGDGDRSTAEQLLLKERASVWSARSVTSHDDGATNLP